MRAKASVMICHNSLLYFIHLVSDSDVMLNLVLFFSLFQVIRDLGH
jgi:hypothetical protein